ncbi:hypothetical protein CONPUDRAFT_73418 [Coniophora puteana RWD-64-598 SS2]|uniref:Uncharacterized protein n=1 Tax=Coniophora puteana (strain RWD-64-598) TaxID=741705 RepID=A0A5M3MN94_CONPW|nr:uncharacterized protein CONPUDRAFT_73418 [Coniophora puteana RWD-64-598 SS2]EIW80244.1 hypothetical protein CONPUDRAFT_73418 [Coniophora puteana RWD-64-598 SS2]
MTYFNQIPDHKNAEHYTRPEPKLLPQQTEQRHQMVANSSSSESFPCRKSASAKGIQKQAIPNNRKGRPEQHNLGLEELKVQNTTLMMDRIELSETHRMHLSQMKQLLVEERKEKDHVVEARAMDTTGHHQRLRELEEQIGTLIREKENLVAQVAQGSAMLQSKKLEEHINHLTREYEDIATLHEELAQQVVSHSAEVTRLQVENALLARAKDEVQVEIKGEGLERQAEQDVEGSLSLTVELVIWLAGKLKPKSNELTSLTGSQNKRKRNE